MPVAAVADYLRGKLAALTKIPVERIDATAPLERYGVDSLLVLSFTRRLEEDLGPLPKSLLYEHQTLASLAAHLATRYARALGPCVGAVAAMPAPEGSALVAPQAAAPVS